MLPKQSDKMFSISVKLNNDSFNYGVKFIDSFSFVNSCFKNLSDNLNQSEHKIAILLGHMSSQGNSDHVLELSTRKGQFCYEAVKSDTALDQTEIPSKRSFTVNFEGKI